MTVVVALLAVAITAGREDVNPDRRECPPVKSVWKAENLDAEILYNGIELPPEWPPKNVRHLDRTEKSIPYLEHPPSVIGIDVGRQLFVDDFLIERTDLRRDFKYPEKYAGNPILKPETAHEINRPGNSCARACVGGVWWDPKIRKFRMWYEAGWLQTVGYAESTDGLKWERKQLDVRPGTNLVFPKDTPRFDSWVVTPDFKTADPYSNWLLFMRPPGPSAQPCYTATSKDGIHWSSLKKGGECGDRSTMFFNPFRGKWVFSLRAEMGPWGKGGTRSRSYREADDFILGSQWKFELQDTTEDVVMWLQPDDAEPRDALLKLPPQLYNFDAVAYESIMLGAYSIWRGPENDVIVKKGMPKITDVEFGYSRDGFHFAHPERTPAIASERWFSGKWDTGYVQSMPNLLVVVDEKLLFYYGAAEGNPSRLGIGGFTCDQNGCYDRGASGVAILRRDGFAAMRPAVGKESGELVTRPLLFSGKCLFVNAACSKGSLKVELLDLDGNVINPYSAENCEAFSADSTKTRIAWKGADCLSALVGKPVRFRFLLKEGELYSFWVSRSERGESCGYLGGGGPDYPGVQDL